MLTESPTLLPAVMGVPCCSLTRGVLSWCDELTAWGPCTVTMAQLVWVLLHSSSLMTPSQGHTLSLHQAAWPPEGKKRRQNSLQFPRNHCSCGQELSFQSCYILSTLLA